MVEGWRGTWLAPAGAGVAPADAEDRVRYRLLLLACIFCGIIQKPLITFAWDVQAFEDCLRELHAKKASLALMGGTAILLRQVFALCGQVLVKEMAVALADAGGHLEAEEPQHVALSTYAVIASRQRQTSWPNVAIHGAVLDPEGFAEQKALEVLLQGEPDFGEDV